MQVVSSKYLATIQPQIIKKISCGAKVSMDECHIYFDAEPTEALLETISLHIEGKIGKVKLMHCTCRIKLPFRVDMTKLVATSRFRAVTSSACIAIDPIPETVVTYMGIVIMRGCDSPESAQAILDLYMPLFVESKYDPMPITPPKKKLYMGPTCTQCKGATPNPRARLVCCDGCPAEICFGCLAIDEAPKEDEWFCKACTKV